MTTETNEVEQVVSRYHQAFTDKDLKAALSCVGRGYYGDAKSTEAMRKRLARAFKSPKTSYANKIEFVYTSVAKRPGLAMVVTKETGGGTWLNGRKGSWKGITNLWCLAKVRGRWKIIRSLHHLGKGRVSSSR